MFQYKQNKSARPGADAPDKLRLGEVFLPFTDSPKGLERPPEHGATGPRLGRLKMDGLFAPAPFDNSRSFFCLSGFCITFSQTEDTRAHIQWA